LVDCLTILAFECSNVKLNYRLSSAEFLTDCSNFRFVGIHYIMDYIMVDKYKLGVPSIKKISIKLGAILFNKFFTF